VTVVSSSRPAQKAARDGRRRVPPAHAGSAPPRRHGRKAAAEFVGAFRNQQLTREEFLSLVEKRHNDFG